MKERILGLRAVGGKRSFHSQDLLVKCLIFVNVMTTSAMASTTKLLVIISILSNGSFLLIYGKAEERTNLKTIFDLLINIGNKFYFENNDVNISSRLDCPLCDSSVYSYCSEKLLHDACCCLNSYEHKLPHQCKYADCTFLHANSCREHKLITACCCSKLYEKRTNH